MAADEFFPAGATPQLIEDLFFVEESFFLDRNWDSFCCHRVSRLRERKNRAWEPWACAAGGLSGSAYAHCANCPSLRGCYRPWHGPTGTDRVVDHFQLGNVIQPQHYRRTPSLNRRTSRAKRDDKLVQAALDVLVPLYTGEILWRPSASRRSCCQYLLAGPGRKHHHDMSEIDKERPLDVFAAVDLCELDQRIAHRLHPETSRDELGQRINIGSRSFYRIYLVREGSNRSPAPSPAFSWVRPAGSRQEHHL